jgi:hypothetical protein
MVTFVDPLAADDPQQVGGFYLRARLGAGGRVPRAGRGLRGPERTTLRPIEITQPEGPSFTVVGSLVRWQDWSLRVGFDARGAHPAPDRATGFFDRNPTLDVPAPGTHCHPEHPGS